MVDVLWKSLNCYGLRYGNWIVCLNPSLSANRFNNLWLFNSNSNTKPGINQSKQFASRPLLGLSISGPWRDHIGLAALHLELKHINESYFGIDSWKIIISYNVIWHHPLDVAAGIKPVTPDGVIFQERPHKMVSDRSRYLSEIISSNDHASKWGWGNCCVCLVFHVTPCANMD